MLSWHWWPQALTTIGQRAAPPTKAAWHVGTVGGAHYGGLCKTYSRHVANVFSLCSLTAFSLGQSIVSNSVATFQTLLEGQFAVIPQCSCSNGQSRRQRLVLGAAQSQYRSYCFVFIVAVFPSPIRFQSIPTLSLFITIFLPA